YVECKTNQTIGSLRQDVGPRAYRSGHGGPDRLDGEHELRKSPDRLGDSESEHRQLLGFSVREPGWKQEDHRREKEAADGCNQKPEAFRPLCRSYVQGRHGDLQVERLRAGFQCQSSTAAVTNAVDPESGSR